MTRSPGDTEERDALDDEVIARLASSRPALDPIAGAVLRAQAARVLFGAAPPVLVGRYELVRAVGEGGGGAVFVARDPELGREVAIKLVMAAGADLRARAVAEGQALAKLAHPNIVPVFDVGTFEDRVYLVMELVRGRSLREHAARTPRLRDVVRAYRQAGEGLAAAHAAGLVHRDFKPDNAVVGADGRVRLIDFGLAVAAGDQRERIAVAGTPAYMAPEQRRGEAITPASDQYAFAVSLREAAGPAAPRWLESVCRRGAADDPGARFPSMRALLRALDDDPATRWRRRAWVALPVAFAAVGFFAGRGDDDAAARCDGALALAPAWTAARAAGAQTRVAALATPFATVEAPRLRAVIDGYAGRWIAGHDAACRAHRRGALSPALYDRQVACLASAKNRLEASIDLLAGIDAEGLAPAARALSELPDLERCEDPAALMGKVAPPPVAQAGEVAAMSAELDRAQVMIEAARPNATALATTVTARARALGYRPLLARALLAQGRAELAMDRRSEAVAPLGEAVWLALAVGDDATAVEAFARKMWAKSRLKDERADALTGLVEVAAVAEGLEPRDLFARALLHNNASSVEHAAGHTEPARAHLATALGLARQVSGPGAVELAKVRSNLALITTDPEERQRLLAEAAAVLQARVGADHPLALEARIDEAFHQADPVRALASLRPRCRRYAALHPTRRAHLTSCAYELVWLDLLYGTRADARTSVALVLEAADAKAHEDRVAIVRAHAALLDGDARGALQAFATLSAGQRPGPDAVWWQLLTAAEVELGRALAARDLGERATAAAALDTAIGYLERVAASLPVAAVTRRLEWARRARADQSVWK